jgi:hypothetical protein
MESHRKGLVELELFKSVQGTLLFAEGTPDIPSMRVAVICQ